MDGTQQSTNGQSGMQETLPEDVCLHEVSLDRTHNQLLASIDWQKMTTVALADQMNKTSSIASTHPGYVGAKSWYFGGKSAKNQLKSD
jgi:hypothetical protein